MNKDRKSSSIALTEYLYSKASQKHIPISGTFELSPVCNFSCKMCYVRKTKQEVQASSRQIMTLNDWRRIAKEAHGAGMLYLLLTGGEPFLWPDFWTLYDELMEMGFLLSINSNGSLIDKVAVEHLLRKPPRRINITLYGASDETYKRLCGIEGVFTKVDKNVRALMEAGISVKLNCSLTPDNEKDLDWIIDYAKARDTVLSVATYMFPPVRRNPEMIGINDRFTPEEMAKYWMHYMCRERGEEGYQHYLKRVLEGSIEPPGLEDGCLDPLDGRVRCRAGKASFWITWDGWLTSCGMMPEPKIELKNQRFGDAWEQLVNETEALRMSGVCNKCQNRNICHPCAAIAYAETGNYGGIPTYKCHATVEMQKIAKASLVLNEELENLP